MSGGISQDTNIGEELAVVTSVVPQSAGTAVLAGTAIDRYAHNGAQSCVLHLGTGASTGSPSAVSAQATLQHSNDNGVSDPWTNYSLSTQGLAAATQQTSAIGASADASANIPLTGAKRYIRSSVAVTFTGGSSPTVQVMSDIVLGGEQERPAV